MVARPAGRQNVVVRAVQVVLAVLGGCAVAAAVAVDIAQGHLASAGWVAVGPLPFYAVGLAAYLSQPDSRAVRWLLAIGVGFATEVALCDGLRAIAAAHASSAVVGTFAIARQYAELGSSFAGLGVLGLFPSGRPERPVERRLLYLAAVSGLLLPVVCALCAPTLAPGFFAGGDDPVVSSPLHVPALAPLAGVASGAYRLYAGWTLVGVGLLGVRFKRSQGRRRRQIGWVHLGAGLSIVLAWMPLLLTTWLVGQPTSDVIAALLWPAALLFALVPMVVALRYEGVFGIDRPSRRALAIKATRVLLTLVQLAIAAAAGLVVSRFGPPVVAVLTAVVVAVAFAPVRRRLEHLADRWVFGARLDGYSLLSQFGAAVVRVPGPEQLLQELADTLRRALNLTWVQVQLGGPNGQSVATVAASGAATPEPALAIPIVHSGETLGTIECGPRADGQLLPEDRRQLEYLAAQVAAAARNVYLSAELAAGVAVIRQQAKELTASRERMAASQDAERRRIQRNLHDGVQQEVVALSAKVGLVRQRLRRGDPGADELLAELQRELGVLLTDIRDVAYAIHPPVLTDRGLLEAIEAQAARLPVPMAVRADPALRGVRFPAHIEATAWYALAEVLSNVVKHAGAGEVEVALRHDAGVLALSVRDDGRGFDPQAPRGLGLTGLADRMDTIGGSVTIHSGAGTGTAISLRIPLPRAAAVAAGGSSGRSAGASDG